MKTLLIGTLLLLILGCKSEKEDFIQKIAGNDFKYWDCKGRMKDSKKQSLNKPGRPIYFMFSKNGEYREYGLSGKNTMYDIHHNSDYLVSNKWEYLSSKKIQFNDDKAEITFLSKDSLAYRSSGFIYCFTPTKKRPKIVDESEAFKITIIDTPKGDPSKQRTLKK